jgi:hypothetical protein
MPKAHKRMADDNRADELLEDLERLAEMFDKHDLKLQRKVTETLKQAVEAKNETEPTDR